MKTIQALTDALNAAHQGGRGLAETKIADLIDELVRLHGTPALFTATLSVKGGALWTVTAITANAILDNAADSALGNNGEHVSTHFTVEARKPADA